MAVCTSTNLFDDLSCGSSAWKSSRWGRSRPARWRSALDMWEAGFPRTEGQLLDRYEVLSQTVSGDVCQLRLQPRAESFRRLMPRLEIDFDTRHDVLRGTEMQFADGSTMRMISPTLSSTRNWTRAFLPRRFRPITRWFIRKLDVEAGSFGILNGFLNPSQRYLKF